MSRRGWILFAAMSVIWGIPYLMIKVAVEGVSVPVLVFARCAIGAVVLLPLALFRGQLAGLRRKWLPLIAFAVVEMVIPWALLSDAERRLTSSMSGLLVAAVPIIGVVLARLTGDVEVISAKRWAGLVIGLVGVGVLAAPELNGGDAWAIVEVLLTALGYAIGPIIAARALSDVPGLPMAAVCLSFAAVVYTVPAIATWPDAVPQVSVLAAIVALGLVCTALAFLLFFALIREAGPARATVITYVNPAVAVLAGVVILGEPLTVTIVAAFALILSGSALATTRAKLQTS
jgi:drug/metabolite transporter (DMT)-like permease